MCSKNNFCTLDFWVVLSQNLGFNFSVRAAGLRLRDGGPDVLWLLSVSEITV